MVGFRVLEILTAPRDGGGGVEGQNGMAADFRPTRSLDMYHSCPISPHLSAIGEEKEP